MSTAAVIQGAGAVMTASGHAAEGEARAKASEYNAQIADRNAGLSRQNAAEEERRQRVMSRKALGDMRANYAASGIQMEGSPLDILEESAGAAELDALTIRHGGAVKAAQFESESHLERFQGHMYKSLGYLKATSSLLSAGSGAAAAGASGGGGGGGGAG